jgi:hypothetical protein
MVQIIGRPEKRRDAGDSFAQAIMGISQIQEERKKKEKTEKETIAGNKAIKEQYGIDLSDIKNPEERKILLQGEMQRRNLAAKLSGEEAEATRSKEISQKAFDRISELIPKVGTQQSILTLGGRTSESFGEFTSLLGALESRLVELVNKGTLSNTRFNYIKNELLPKANDSQETIRGKMKGLALELDLDPSALTPKKKGKKVTSVGVSGPKDKRPLSSFSGE